ncbi:peptidase U32 family protein [Gaoshiqia sediminis]|uniref:U32 family peptidase n=1 Tax=Gaoshiqia sediminis TaxID=2986998 RepID=A0AA41Y4K6_9BACT|nr:peptidase U32 family protein [Gaoshiqia sediminis]MCW0481725.1 U32 family peptidase [Gaoshiqia sediminis]
MGQNKPELLLPAGNVESFRAAIRGGANAVYLGLKQFNARARANNFTENQLPAILQEAHRNKVKVYVTLNTVIKNPEIDKLLDFLFYLEKVGVDAIIVQDWGVYDLARQYFPKLAIHASTQMGTHNSQGVTFAARLGLSRVVLARELTMPELEKIARQPACELEVFIHGALCYSFSGQCFFSSYVGGRGANRGLCSQPCRMVYQDSQQQKYLFNLKDNQQLPNLPRMAELGIHSLKVEGRMKSADYVFRVAAAYRLALDHPERTVEAEEMLQLDFGRAKTNYFLGNDVKEAIADTSNTGIPVGTIIRVNRDEITFVSDHELKNGDRLRILQAKTQETCNVKLEDVWEESGCYSFTHEGKEKLSAGDEVFWIGRREQSFPSRLPNVPAPTARLPLHQKKAIKQKLSVGSQAAKPCLFVRIDSPDWLNTIRLTDVDGLILSFGRHELEKFDFSSPVIQQNRYKIHLELPKFIAEGQLPAWERLLQKAEESGIRQFFISHLSQKLFFSKDSQVCCNEQVYVYNDAAARFLSTQKIKGFCYPVENDFDNLKAMQRKDGFVLLHTLPELFYSRMPVGLDDAGNHFKDNFNKTYSKLTHDGITLVIPDRPVNLFQYKEQLLREGFRNFMIDLKHEQPSKNLIKRLLLKYRAGEPVQPSTIFNFKKGLQ